MRVAILALALVVSATWLASGSAAVPTTRDLTLNQPVAEGCGYGWHRAGGYTASNGSWVPGYCQIDR